MKTVGPRTMRQGVVPSVKPDLTELVDHLRTCPMSAGAIGLAIVAEFQQQPVLPNGGAQKQAHIHTCSHFIHFIRGMGGRSEGAWGRDE